MKKINLLPTFSITQQKEMAQWHRYTMIAFAILCMGAVLFQLFYVVRAHAIKKDIAMLRKKTQPYDPFIKTLQQTRQDISRLQQQIVEFKKIAQQTLHHIDVVSKIVTDLPPMKSLILNNDEIELSLLLPNASEGNREIVALQSCKAVPGLILSSIQGKGGGRISAVLRGKIA